MQLSLDIINRDAGDKAKGPRLQRLRCALLLLKAIEESDKPHVYGAVEYKEDVFIKDFNNGQDYLEQNKNYNEETSFTLNSPEVIKAMVNFCDMWIEYIVKSKKVFLGFYATNSIGKESKTNKLKELKIELPDKPILDLLQEHSFDHPKLLDAVKGIVLSGYKDAYKKSEGNIKSLEALTNEDWKKFLKCIDWKFGELTEDETKEVIIEKIKACKFYNHENIGKEEAILAQLMDLLDERQCVEEVLGKFVNASDVELIYMKNTIAASMSRQEDPVYKIWESIPPPIDKRNITDKILAVCQNYEPQKISAIARKTAASRILQDTKSADKDFLSLRYRIFEKCADELESYLTKIDASILTQQAEVDKLIEYLYEVAKAHVNEISSDFKYALKSGPIVEGIVLELFDSCFLALN